MSHLANHKRCIELTLKSTKSTISTLNLLYTHHYKVKSKTKINNQKLTEYHTIWRI